MMRRVVLWVLLFLVVVSSSSATDRYRLRVPHVEEYLRALPQIFDLANASIAPSHSDYFDLMMFSALDTELRWRFSDLPDADVHLLYETFNYLLRSGAGEWQWELDRDFWGEAIVSALLTQFDGEPDEETTLNLKDWEVIITPRDFNADGRNELMVEVRSDFYARHFVVQHDITGYRIVDAPLPWFGCCFPYWIDASGFMSELLFADMTGDGKPEWVLALGGVGGGHQNHGHLYILTWEDNRLIHLSPESEERSQLMSYSAAGGGGAPLFPYGVEVNFEDTNGDGRIEVIITQHYEDNWGCQPTETRIFAWDADVRHFELSEHLWDYPDTAQCALRLAQDAIWDGDYEAAVPLLEHRVALYAEKDFADTQAVYAGVRLALAYAFTGRSEEAVTLLDALNLYAYEALPPIDELVIQARDAYSQQMNAFDLCLSLYDTFDRYFRSDWLTDTYWGVTDNIVVPLVSAGAPGRNPRTAGCPAPELLDALLVEPLVMHIPPIEQLTSRGISVMRANTADLNGDDRDDWLIVLNADIAPILLLSVGEGAHYHLSRVDIQNPQRLDRFISWQLPDGTPALLGYFYNDTTSIDQQGDPDWWITPSCPDAEVRGAPGGITLIALQDDHAAFVQELPLCEPWELNRVFPEGEGSRSVQTWLSHPDEETYVPEPYRPGILIWDDTQRRYMLPQGDEPDSEIPVETPVEAQNETTDIHNLQEFIRQQVVTNFAAGNYADVLDAVATFLSVGVDAPLTDRAMLYYRALALEALGRDDEALEVYVAIYQAAPESAWGMLAALHLEVTDAE